MVEVLSSETSCCSAEKYEDDFEFPLSSSSSYSAEYINSQLEHQNSADELFFQGKLLPLLDIPPTLHLKKLLFTHQNFIIPINTHDHRSIIPSTKNPSTPPDSRHLSYNLDDLENDSFYEWSKEARGFTHHTQPPPPPQQFTKKRLSNWPQRLFYKLKATRGYLRCLFFTKSATCTSSMDSDISNKEQLSIFEKKAAGYNNNNYNKKRISLRDLFFESHRKSFSGAGSIQRDQCSGGPHVSLSSSSSLSSAPNSFLSSCSSNCSASSNDDFQTMLKRSRSADPELERESSIRDAIAHCKL